MLGDGLKSISFIGGYVTKLSVNINKLATIRNARGGNNPSLIYWAKKIESFGAHGITIHPRPDERHIKKTDVFDLKPVIKTEFNLEGYPSADFIKLIKEVQPEQCTLVPDPPEALTSNAGWDVNAQEGLLKSALSELNGVTRLSVFVEPRTTSFDSAKKIKDWGADRAELYTENFALNQTNSGTLKKYRMCADQLLEAGLELNAGHDLDLNNLSALIELLPEVKEVSIGHALICESLELGMEETIKRYLNLLSIHK